MPADRLWPRVVGFLGYDPTPPPASPGQRLRAARRSMGLSINALARALSCHEDLPREWERGKAPRPHHAAALRKLLGSVWDKSSTS